MIDPVKIPPMWEEIAASVSCAKCGSSRDNGFGPIIGPGTEQHYGKLTCGDCGSWIRWLPNPGRKPPRDRNLAARAYWTEVMAGELVCVICGITEKSTSADFDIHHIIRIEDGGRADAVEETIPLCHDCHVIAEALRAHQRHARGLSARNTAS